MSEENVKIIRRGYERFAAGDLEGVAELFAAEAEMPGGGGLGIGGTMGLHRGPHGMMSAMQEGLDAFDDFRAEVEEMIESRASVVAVVRLSGRGKASGMAQEMRVAHLWVLRDGRVIHGEVFRTKEEALAAAAETRE